MATTIFSLEDYRRLDKSKWSKMIPRWNRQRGFVKRIAKVIGVFSMYDTPAEQRRAKRQSKRYEKLENRYYAPKLDWEEVPQRLPYQLSDDRTRMYVASDFLELCAK